jgi:hypothetical protein
MPDDRKKTGKPDRVNVLEARQLREWAKHWRCTQADIFEAVKAVGDMAKDVEAWLRRNGKMH